MKKYKLVQSSTPKSSTSFQSLFLILGALCGFFALYVALGGPPFAVAQNTKTIEERRADMIRLFRAATDDNQAHSTELRLQSQALDTTNSKIKHLGEAIEAQDSMIQALRDELWPDARPRRSS